MADAIDGWLDELAGRQPGDAMTAALRQHLLDQQPQNNDIAFQKLLTRLDAEGLLKDDTPKASGLSERKKWSAPLAAAASVLLLVSVLLPLVLKENAPLSSASYRELPATVMQKSAAPDALLRDSIPESAKPVMSAPAFQAQRQIMAETKSEAASSICRRQGTSAQAELQIVALNLDEVRQLYAELAGINGLMFHYESAHRTTRIEFTSVTQRQRFKLMLMSFADGDCDLSGIKVLHLSLPIGEVQ